MSTVATTAPSHTNPTRRGRGRGRGGRGGHLNLDNRRGAGGRNTPRTNGKKAEIVASPQKEEESPVSVMKAVVEESAASVEDNDAAICWICAEPVKYYSVPECNHRTCHVCALRLRALYKKTDCTFCKEPQPTVIYTTSANAEFSSFNVESMTFKDTKLSIYFERQDMMEETLILLRFNCPDPDCDYIGNGWGDLKLHVRATHGKFMCDLCIRFKKVFSHEHALYTPNLLPVHLPSMHRQYRAPAPKEQIDGGGGVHPMCEFCRECFFGDDELYAHMREKHEECFVCKRNEIRDQYFQNYQSLEDHFNNAHYPCTQSQCLARKFVVFNTKLDLQAHMVEEHGGDMSARDKKDARRIQADFEFEEVGRHGRRDRGNRDREPPTPNQRRQVHEPPSHMRLLPRESAPHQRPQPQEPPPYQRRQPHEPPPPTPPIPPGPPGPGRRREFGGALTAEGGANAPPNNNNTPNTSRPPSPPHGDVDAATLERHAMVVARLQSLAANQTTAVPVVKAAVRAYRASESSARDLISTIWNVLDQNLEYTASIVNAFVDLLEQEQKKQDLLASWKGFVIEQRQQFPDLVPTATGSGWAAITSGRVLNAKNSTATRSAQQSSRQVWDRVAQAASSSFPRTLPAVQPSVTTLPTPAFRQAQRTTPWSASGSSGFRPPSTMPSNTIPSTNQSITVIPDPRTSRPSSGASTPKQPPPKLSDSLFPELPTAAPRQKAPVSGNISLKNVLGNPTPAAPAWQGQAGNANGNGNSIQPLAAGTEGETDATTTTPGKSKKGKGKQKQTLFTLGSFPA